MISRANKILGRVLFWTIAAIHGAIVVVLFLGVVMRYVFDAPLFWSEEVSLLGLIWLTFLGGTVLVRQDKNVSITILTNRLPPRAKRWLDYLNHLLIILCLVVMIDQSWKLSEHLYYSTTPALRLRECWFGAALVVSFVLMLFYQIQRFVAGVRGRVAFPDEAVCHPEDSSHGERCNL
jgi:TRAP-type transport system small permease protein